MKAFTLLLITALCGSVAAEPDRRTPYDDPRHDVYQNHDRDRDYRFGHDRQGWTELVSPTTTRNGTEWIDINDNSGRISQLRVVANEGRVDLRFVTVTYRDGSRRTYRVNRTLSDRRGREVTIQLDRDRHISQIAVRTDPRDWGTYTVYGA